MSHRIVCQRQIGHRRRAGTDWPISEEVCRQQHGRRVRWVHAVVCNGVAEHGARVYRTRRAALEAFGEYAEAAATITADERPC